MLNRMKDIASIGTLLQKVIVVTIIVCSGWSSLAVAEDAPANTGTASKPAVIQVSATASNATPSAAVSLAYKFRPGQFVHYAGTSRIQYLSQLNGQTYLTSQSNETWTHFRVVTVDEQGMATIEPIIDRTRMKAALPGKDPVIFDSNEPADARSEFDTIRAAIGRSIARFQVMPTGKLVKAILTDATAPATAREAAEKLDTRFPYLPLLPTTPVTVGHKWREEYSVIVVNSGLKEPIPTKRIFELTGVTNGIATIKFRTIVLRPLNEPELDKQIIQQTPTGVIEFSIERGMVVSYTANIDRSTINAFGPESLLHVTGKSTETLTTVAVNADSTTKPTVVDPSAGTP